MSACTCGHLATSHNATAYTASECAEQCHCEAYRDAEAEQLRARIVRLLSIIAELDAEIARLRESFADELQAMVASDQARTVTRAPILPRTMPLCGLQCIKMLSKRLHALLRNAQQIEKTR